MKLFSSRMRVELRRSRRSAVIFAVGLLAAVVAIGIVISKENVHLPWETEQTVQIQVTNATGVVAGLDEVRWAGIVVGRITKVRFVDGRPVLTAELNSGDLHGAKLYQNARIDLRPQTPLSDMYLDIVYRGDAKAGALTSSDILPADQTQVPVDVADVLNTFSEPIRDRLQELLNELATGLSPAGGQQLREAFGEIAPLLVAQKTLSETVAHRQVLVKELIHDSSAVFSTLTARNTELDALIKRGSGTLGALGSQSPALSQLIAELPGTLTQMKSSFDQLQTTLAVVRPALTDLLPTARELPSGLSALKSFSQEAKPALVSLEPAIASLNPLAKDLPGTATALNHAFATLEPQAPELDKITTAIVPCELNVDKFFAWTLSVLKFDNSDNHTSSPRGTLVAGPFEDPTAKDPTLSPGIGCADGKPAPTTPTQSGQ